MMAVMIKQILMTYIIYLHLWKC